MPTLQGADAFKSKYPSQKKSVNPPLLKISGEGRVTHPARRAPSRRCGICCSPLPVRGRARGGPQSATVPKTGASRRVCDAETHAEFHVRAHTVPHLRGADIA